MTRVTVLGAGLAGSEAALTLARFGIAVTLVEAKPINICPDVYQSEGPSELVCSNSLKSESPATASYMLKEELRRLQCRVLACAETAKVPAGESLAVDRVVFTAIVKKALIDAGITYIEGARIATLAQLYEKYPADRYIIATGPLTDETMVHELASTEGYFYDAIAPVVSAEGLDMEKMFWGDRYERGTPDFLNIALNKEQYLRFYEALIAAEKLPYNEHEKPKFFERCMPIEEIARRGVDTLRFGPFKPAGFRFSGRMPYALLQLRTENTEKTAFNLVGCQTRMRQHAQKSVFSLLPGLEQAEFLRYGSVHRNSYINAPEVLADDWSVRGRPELYVAGQLSGVEGYVESIFSGHYTARVIAAALSGKIMPLPPATSMSGGMLRKLRIPVSNFQPVNAMFALIDRETGLKKRERKVYLSTIGLRDYDAWVARIPS